MSEHVHGPRSDAGTGTAQTHAGDEPGPPAGGPDRAAQGPMSAATGAGDNGCGAAGAQYAGGGGAMRPDRAQPHHPAPIFGTAATQPGAQPAGPAAAVPAYMCVGATGSHPDMQAGGPAQGPGVGPAAGCHPAGVMPGAAYHGQMSGPGPGLGMPGAVAYGSGHYGIPTAPAAGVHGWHPGTHPGMQPSAGMGVPAPAGGIGAHAGMAAGMGAGVGQPAGQPATAGPPGVGQQAGMSRMLGELTNGGSGLASLGRLLNVEDSEFWKGALVGAAAVLLLTNETVQETLFKAGAKAKDAVRSGADKLKEAADDIADKAKS